MSAIMPCPSCGIPFTFEQIGPHRERCEKEADLLSRRLDELTERVDEMEAFVTRIPPPAPSAPSGWAQAGSNATVMPTPAKAESGKDERRWTLHVSQGVRFTPYDGEHCSGQADCPESKHHVEVVPLAALEAERRKRENLEFELRDNENMDAEIDRQFAALREKLAAAEKALDDTNAMWVSDQEALHEARATVDRFRTALETVAGLCRDGAPCKTSPEHKFAQAALASEPKGKP